MKRYFLLTALSAVISMQAAELTQLTSVHAPRGERLFTDGMDYFVQHEGRTSKVPTWYTSTELRGRDLTTLAAMQQAGYVDVHQMHGDAYRLDFKPRGKGGAVFGAMLGIVAGKTLVYAVSGTAIHFISALTGPAYPATFAVLSGWSAPFIETAAIHAAVVGGIVGGVATGPV